MTWEDLQYLFETATITELQRNLTTKIIFGYADIQLRQIPAHLFDSPDDWRMLCSIRDQHRRTHSVSAAQLVATLIILKKHSSQIQV
jgi:hypothetical protein